MANDTVKISRNALAILVAQAERLNEYRKVFGQFMRECIDGDDSIVTDAAGRMDCDEPASINWD